MPTSRTAADALAAWAPDIWWSIAGRIVLNDRDKINIGPYEFSLALDPASTPDVPDQIIAGLRGHAG